MTAYDKPLSGPAGREKPKRKPNNRRELPHGTLMASLFILPAVILVAVLMYYPMVSTFRESLYTTSFLSPTPEFVGFETYRDMFGDDEFWQIVTNTLIWTAAVVIFQNIVGMGAALLVNENLPTRGIVRAVILLPWVLPGIIGAILWRFMYDPQLGLINSMLLGWGIIDGRIGWLAETQTAMMAVIIAAVWKGFPFSTVIFLAALQGVDKEQIEAAQIDGANVVQRFFRIIIPSMAGIIRLNLLLTTIFTFNYFDMVWVTTGGGPLDATHIFPTRIYELGFGQFRFGEASAYGVISVVMLSIFALLYLNELRPSKAER
ncbi:MAG: sugar ABC transporter permease [Chloroflexota bacterium]